ncbi:MAG: hypothetical protein DLM72_16325 [Candidatus Nitrosopolaris wilkensis]|nr:MAG: hypothetical protein DLM72_16325 [Candidatus Nitrosopolaris wilkensis]
MVVEQGVQLLGQSLQDLIRLYVSYLTFGIDIAAGIVIGISAGIAFVAFLKILHKPIMDQTMEKETIRLRLARGILLALDFEVASDILKSILIPAVGDLTILAVVVAIRIALSWSLSQEVDKHLEQRQR